MTHYRNVLIILIALVVTACQRQNEVELTLVAQNLSLETQIAAIRETATVDAERIQITVDYMGTLVGRVEEQRFQMEATLSARNIPADGNLNNADPLTTPFPTPGGPVENTVEGTPATPLPEQAVTPTEVATEPMLQNIVMSSSVGSDDCANGVTSSFTTDTVEIYVVANAINIPAGTNIAARFSVAGQEIRHDFTPDFNIDNNCVWFFIDQTDLTFQAGNWSVQLELNGEPVGGVVPFTITEAT